MQKSEQINDLATALCAAQESIEGASKDSKGYNYKYANLENVMDCLKAPFAKNGLSYVQSSRTENGEIILVTILMHKSGQWISGEMPVKVSMDGQSKMNALQSLGSGLSYMRRYALTSMCGVAQIDDDGTSTTPKNNEPLPPQNVGQQQSYVPKSGSRASSAQVKYIKELCAKKNIEVPANINDMPGTEASKLIKSLTSA